MVLKIINKSPVQIVKELALAVYQFFMKQDLKNNGIPYISICPTQGAFSYFVSTFLKELWPVHLAARKERLKSFQFLTENMHNINPGDKITMEIHTSLALHFAALFGHLNTICKHIIEELTD